MDEAGAIAGRVAIVTGAGHGLGRAESLALAGAGARLVLNDLPGDAVRAVAAEVTAAGGHAVVADGDVAGAPVYARIVNTSSEAFLLGSVGQPNYAAAKAGIAALTWRRWWCTWPARRPRRSTGRSSWCTAGWRR